MILATTRADKEMLAQAGGETDELAPQQLLLIELAIDQHDAASVCLRRALAAHHAATQARSGWITVTEGREP